MLRTGKENTLFNCPNPCVIVRAGSHLDIMIVMLRTPSSKNLELMALGSRKPSRSGVLKALQRDVRLGDL